MAMTQAQLDWRAANRQALIDAGYNPDETEITPDGQLVRVPRRGMLETLVHSGARSILPGIAGIGSGVMAGAAGGSIAGPPGTIIGALLGAIAGGGATGLAQEAILNKVAPESQEAYRQAAEQHPWTDAIASNAITFATGRPNVRPIANALALGRGAISPALKAAGMNAGINAGGAIAGQGVNMAMGGDFNWRQALADTAIGGTFTDASKLGQRLGLPRSSEDVKLAPVVDLAYERSTMERARSGAPYDKDWAKLPALDVPEPTKAEIKLADKVRSTADKEYTKWWKSETAPTEELFKQAIAESKLTIPKERLAELQQMPEAIAALKSPEAFKDFVWASSEEALQAEYAHQQAQKGLLTAEEIPGAEKFRDVKLAGEMARGRAEAVKRRENQDWLDASNQALEAEEAVKELESRFSRAGVADQPLTQAELEAMTQVAARRGLTLEFQDLGANRGQYILSTKEGQPLLRVNPLTATMDTIAHELGHDTFNRSASEGMRKSLIEAATDSDVYRAELATRLKAGMSQQEAHAIAAEEGIVDAFAKASGGDPSDIKAWFRAFKASVKNMAGMKLSPEDAVAWMHYATHNDTPFSGLGGGSVGVRNQGNDDELSYAMAKVGQEQRGHPESFGVNSKDSVGYRLVGELSNRLEHVGDLIHRVSFNDNVNARFAANSGGGSKFGRDAALNKINNALRDEKYVRSLGGLKQLVAKDSKEVFDYWKTTPKYAPKSDIPLNAQEAFLVAKGYMQDYADSHATLQPVTKAQKLANEATIALGRLETDTYFDKLKELQTLLSGDDWESRYYQRVDNSNVRNQGPSLTSAADPEVKKLTAIHAPTGEAFSAAFNTSKRLLGELESGIQSVAKLSEAHKKELLKHVADEMDNGALAAPRAHLAAAYADLRKVIASIPDLYNQAGFQIRTDKGGREHGSGPSYMPLHHSAPSVRTILNEGQGSAAYNGLRKDFIDFTAKYLNQRANMPMADALIEAQARFDREVNEFSHNPDPTAKTSFAGVRKPQGAPLPPSWRSDDIMGNLNNYFTRVSKDYAAQKHIESSPEVMAALGAKRYGQDLDIPPAILESTPPIISSKVTQAVLRDYSGRMADDSQLAKAGRLVGSLALGPVSRATDVMTTLPKGLVYLGASDYLEGTMAFVKGLSDWAALKSRSYQSGLNRLDNGANMRQVMGVGADAADFMTKAAALISKGTGLDNLESIARTLAQNWGETIIKIKKRQALTGDQNAVRFLDTLSKDWRSRDDLDLSAQIGRLLQGSYDTTQLPAYMLEGGLAPFLTWSKWSMGQLQAFNDFAIAPLLRGDPRPLVGQMVIGLLGGAAVQEVREWINNRETRDINWSELEAWAAQNKGEIGAPGSILLASKLLTMAQQMGTFGFAGDLAKSALSAAAGQSPQGVLHNPPIEAIFDVGKNAAAALSAISEGEDVSKVLGKLATNLAKNHVQVFRTGLNHIDVDENIAYGDRRRQNLFDVLSGEGSKNGAFSVSYKDLAEKEFDKAREPEDIAAKAGALIEEAAAEATSHDDFIARMRKLGTARNSVMPNPGTNPDKAFKFLKWIHDAEGAETADNTYARWLAEDARAKYRKRLVSPGSAGAR